jgi:hypothetical protein
MLPIFPGVAMHLMSARSAFILVLSAIITGTNLPPKHGVVAEIEPPRSLGTPLTEVARLYTGPGLADKIAGRLRLDTDASLTPYVRHLIRMHLAQES